MAPEWPYASELKAIADEPAENLPPPPLAPPPPAPPAPLAEPPAADPAAAAAAWEGPGADEAESAAEPSEANSPLARKGEELERCPSVGSVATTPTDEALAHRSFSDDSMESGRTEVMGRSLSVDSVGSAGVEVTGAREYVYEPSADEVFDSVWAKAVKGKANVLDESFSDASAEGDAPRAAPPSVGPSAAPPPPPPGPAGPAGACEPEQPMGAPGEPLPPPAIRGSVFLMPAQGVDLDPAVAAASLWEYSLQPQHQQFAPLPQPFQHLQHQAYGLHQQPPQSLHQDSQPLACFPPTYQQPHCEPQGWCSQQPCHQQTFQQQPLHPQSFHQPFHVAAPQQPCLPHLQPPAATMVVRACGALAAQPAQPAPPAPLDEHEVVAAVETLYADLLKPYGRILRKRLEERAVAAGRQAHECDASALRAICESCCVLLVEGEAGGDWSVLLRDRQDSFVDVYSPDDVYPASLWSAIGRYLEGPEGAALKLAGGRYSCAQDLVARRLPFLAGLPLGQVCHLVQLAISQKKLLGYFDGAVVPYWRSQSMLKQRCAERECASGTTAKGAGLGTWDMLRSFLEGALSDLDSEDFIPLSNFKRLFKQRHGTELSETALGHAKLSELLRDPRVSDLCTVRLRNHGYAVFPSQRPGAPAAPPKPICLADSLLGEGPGAGAPPGSAPARRRPAALSDDEGASPSGARSPWPPSGPGEGPEVVFPPTPEGETPHWRGGLGLSLPLPTLLASRARLPAAAAAAEKPEKPSIWDVPLLTPLTMSRLRSSEQRTFIHVAGGPATPQAGSSSRSSSVPRDIH
ncbi:unnamed protein product [Prorocentrum cordatum]|uniref:HTH OST-type domain-containing protein n=1 Tax=Prorocentrum cordatum TaxID=2364126 RepID=A0ABN9RAB9_9DINO|nr:unnamed protein product [Polarella glacialis]